MKNLSRLSGDTVGWLNACLPNSVILPFIKRKSIVYQFYF
ncbi:hypothetical protein Agau_L300532 [Agrobacterium tumefaciens F2]|nr:hypothetical protein Agau_L300532 [Agrobacterium tumefaciens F2]